MAKGLSAAKAKKILKDGYVKGKPLTAKQKKYFGAIANGATPLKAINGGWLDKFEDGGDVPKAQLGRMILKAAKNMYQGAKKFDSSIDWRKWVKYTDDFDNNPDVIKHLNEIEETTKANGTWMKNPDGSAFKGTQEEFVIQQSDNFKKAFPNPIRDAQGNIQINYHGSPSELKGNQFAEYHNKLNEIGTGISTTSKKNYAKGFSEHSTPMYGQPKKPTIYELYQNSNNPQPYPEHLVGTDEYIKMFNRGDISLKEGFDSFTKRHQTIVPFNNYPKSTKGNILFDMTNPNIYKAIVPGAIGTAAASQMTGPVREDGQFKNGGWLDKFGMGGSLPGASGMMYSRNSGTTPEEPKKAQNGKAIDWSKQRKKYPGFMDNFKDEIEYDPEFVDFDSVRRAVRNVESLDGKLMWNPESTATGLYGQRFSEIKNDYPGNRKDFVKDTVAQNKFFERRFYDGLEASETTPLLQDANDLYNDYSPQIKNFPYSKEDIAVLSNFIGRGGTRKYLGYAIRDGKPLAEALPNIYGPSAKQSNKTPEEYLELARQYYKTNELKNGGEIPKAQLGKILKTAIKQGRRLLNFSELAAEPMLKPGITARRLSGDQLYNTHRYSAKQLDQLLKESREFLKNTPSEGYENSAKFKAKALRRIENLEQGVKKDIALQEIAKRSGRTVGDDTGTWMAKSYVDAPSSDQLGHVTTSNNLWDMVFKSDGKMKPYSASETLYFNTGGEGQLARVRMMAPENQGGGINLIFDNNSIKKSGIFPDSSGGELTISQDVSLKHLYPEAKIKAKDMLLNEAEFRGVEITDDILNSIDDALQIKKNKNGSNIPKAQDGTSMISQYEEPAWYEKLLDYAASPMTTLGYLAKGQDLPDRLPINVPGRSEFDNWTFDTINPAAMIKYGASAKRNFEKGEYLDATFDALGAIPIVPSFLKRGKKPVKAATKAAKNVGKNVETEPLRDLFIQPNIYPISGPLPKNMEPYLSRRVYPFNKEQEVFESFLSTDRQLKNIDSKSINYDADGNIIPKAQIGKMLKKANDLYKIYKSTNKVVDAANTVKKTDKVVSNSLNPLEIADQIIPRFNVLGPVGGDIMQLSPLNAIPFYGKNLKGKNMAFRKFGNSIYDVIQRQALSPVGGSDFRMGKNQIVSEGNWAAMSRPSENYSGVFEATFDFNNPFANLSPTGISQRNGVLITDKLGNRLTEIPLTEPGLSFNRRLPFSTRYVPIDKQKLIDNKPQLATFGPRLQSLAEKYGIGLLGAHLIGEEDTYNKYTIDPVIENTEKVFNDLKKMKSDDDNKDELKDGGWLSKYENGGVIEDDRGQWAHPGKVTKINSNNITMKGVNYPVLGISDTGDKKMMQPGKDYKFDGNSVTEYPMAQNGTKTKIYNEPIEQEEGIIASIDNFITPIFRSLTNREAGTRDNINLRIPPGKMKYFRNNEKPINSNYIIGGDYMEDTPTAYKASEYPNTMYTTFGQTQEIDFETQQFYGVVDGNIKLGKKTDFKDDDVIVPLRPNFGGNFSIKQRTPLDPEFIKKARKFNKVTNEIRESAYLFPEQKVWEEMNGMTFAKKYIPGVRKGYNFNPEYKDIIDQVNKTFGKGSYMHDLEPMINGYNSNAYDILNPAGNELDTFGNKVILFDPESNEHLFISHLNKQKRNKEIIDFKEKYPNANYLNLDNGRFTNYMVNKDGITSDDATEYMQNSFKGPDATGYNFAYREGGNVTKAKDGKSLVELNQLTNFTNYNTPQPGGWLNKYN